MVSVGSALYRNFVRSSGTRGLENNKVENLRLSDVLFF
jgi:hypothetical protein